MPTIWTVVIALVAATLAALATFALVHRAARANEDRAREDGRRERDAEVATAHADLRAAERRVLDAQTRLSEAELALRDLQRDLVEQQTARAELGAQLKAEHDKALELRQQTEQMQEQLRLVFQNLANQALEDNQRRASEAQQQQLTVLIEPLREQLKEFGKTVTETHAIEQRERGMLAAQIETLHKATARIGGEAAQLTRALTGDTRAQGAWGEMVLERVLEASGLTRGREYEVQSSLKDDEGGRPRPDVIVRLPDNKDLVIDAKVVLTAYERLTAAVDEAERERERAAHVLAIKRHIQGLSERNYTALEGLRTLDFVLMFVPVEAALAEAARADPGIYELAMRNHIALVCPSTLLATLRTVSYLWSMEKRNVNAQEIARQAARLYDKYVEMLNDLKKLGDQLTLAHKSYDRVINRLSSGKDNLIRKTERLRELGVTPSKPLPPGFKDAAVEFDGEAIESDVTDDDVDATPNRDED